MKMEIMNIDEGQKRDRYYHDDQVNARINKYIYIKKTKR
jgi:hypothetical protein